MFTALCKHARTYTLFAATSLMFAAISCETGQSPQLPQPPNTSSNQLATDPPSPSANNNGPSEVELQSTAVLFQGKNGPAAPATGIVEWVAGNVSANQAHFLESYSIPYRVVMNELPTDGTQIELVIGYDVKNNNKHAAAFLTHHQRLEPHQNNFDHPAEEADPLAGVPGVSNSPSTFLIPEPRGSIIIDCVDGDLAQPAAAFSTLPDAEKVFSLYGGTILNVAYEGAAPDLNAVSAEEQVRIKFTASSSTAVLAWGSYIANRNEFGCDHNPQTAGSSFGSPFVTRLKSWNLNSLTPQQVALSAATIGQPQLVCEVIGPRPVCPNSENVYSVTVTGDCDDPVFYKWDVLGDGEIIGSDEEPTVRVRAGASGNFLVFVTVFCADCEPLICCVVVNITPPPTAAAGPDQASCPAPNGPTCFNLSGSGTNGSPSWSVVTQPAGCTVNITGGNTFTPTVCFPQGCTGFAILRLTVEGQCGRATDEIKLTVNPASTANAGPDQAKCPPPQGPTTFLLAGSGTNGTPAWTVVTQPAGCTVTLTGANTFTPTASFPAGCTGSATLRLTVSGNPPCPASDDIVLTVGTRTSASAGPDQSKCPTPNAPTTFTLAGSGSGGSPSWSIVTQPAGCTVTLAGANTFTPTATFPVGCTGSATLRLTVTGPSGAAECPPSTDDVVLTVQTPATSNAGPDQTKCPAPTGPTCFTLAGSGTNGSPSWTVVTQPAGCSVIVTGGNTFTPTVCFPVGCTGSATLRLTVSGNNDCPPATDEITLIVTAQLTANAGPDATLCVAASGPTCFNLAGSGNGGTPSWSVVTQPAGCSVNISGGNTFTPTVCFPAGCTGSATLRLTVSGDANCPPATDDVTLTVVAGPAANAGPDQRKCPAIEGPTCFSLTGSGTGSPTWTVQTQPAGCTVTLVGANTFTPTVCFPNGCQGSATLRLTVSGHANCPPASDTVVLTVGPSDLACVIDTPTQGGVVTGTITGGTAPYSCSASFGSPGWLVTGCQVSGSSFTVNYTRQGGVCTPTPTITVTIIDDEGCVTECFVEIPCPQGCVARSIIACECPDNPVTICAEPSGGLPPFTYSWRGPNGFIGTTRCITVNEPGIYVVTITDGNGLSETCCSAVVDTHIHGPSPCPGDDNLTYGVEFHFPGGTFTPATYSWGISGNGTFCGPTNQRDVCVNAGDPGVFTLVVNVTGTVTFQCDGATETIPLTGTCALAFVVEDQNCP